MPKSTHRTTSETACQNEPKSSANDSFAACTGRSSTPSQTTPPKKWTSPNSNAHSSLKADLNSRSNGHAIYRAETTPKVGAENLTIRQARAGPRCPFSFVVAVQWSSGFSRTQNLWREYRNALTVTKSTEIWAHLRVGFSRRRGQGSRSRRSGCAHPRDRPCTSRHAWRLWFQPRRWWKADGRFHR
jgi:hypothetical protein